MTHATHDTGIQLASRATIHDLFAEQVAAVPDACALVQGARRLSYRELDQASDQVARLLLDRGVAPEECVVVHAGRTIQMVVASLGVLKAGACYVPLDPGLPAGRKRFILEDTSARFMLIERALDAGEHTWARGTQCCLIEDAWSRSRAEWTQRPQVAPRNLAYVMYTSGSTGKPKGVLIEHRSVVFLVKDNDYVPLERNDRILLIGAIGFDATTFEIWGSLLNGLSLYLADLPTLNDARSLKHALESSGITTLVSTTSFCARRVQEDPAVFRSLKYLLIGGEVLKPSVSNAIRRVAPGLKIINVYGPTESTTIATTFVIDDEYSSSIPIGKPIRGTTAYIVDESLRPLRDERAGEIVLGGEGLARGYLNRPELTRERFVEVAGLGRVYRTGDLGRWQEDGNIQFIGRRDHQVKIGGYRVEPGEIEHALSGIDLVRDCTVSVVERNDEKYLAAYYVPARSGIEPAMLRQKLAGVLPDQLLPTFLIELEALPLSPQGKIERRALPDPFEAGARALKRREHPSTAGHDALADVQTRMKRIWEEVLAARNLDIDADFYALGGTSIKALHLLGAMAAQGIEASLSDVLHHRTVRKISAYVATILKRGGLLKSWPAALEYLREQFPGASLNLGRYSLEEGDGRARELVVLRYQNMPVSRHELLRTLRSSLAAELFPHYVHEGDGQESAGSGRISTQELRELLGLHAAGEISLDELKAQAIRDYQRNDRVIQDGALLEECPFSPMQELQFSFRTPMSCEHFVLDRPLDLELLAQAVRCVIAEQDLLTSIPIKKAGRWYWRKLDVRGAQSLGPSIIDLSGYHCTDAELTALIGELSSAFDFWGEQVLYHMLIIQRNAREHVIVLVVNHVLFDRVSEEAIRRRVLTCYEKLIDKGLSLPDEAPEQCSPERPSFFAYVRQVQRGPADISPPELVQRYALAEFYAQKQKLLTSCGLEPVDCSYCFQIAAPCAGHLESGESLGVALALYTRALGALYGIDSVPLLFICDGRSYRGSSYYDVVGECTDCVPLLLSTRLTPAELQHLVGSRLAALSAHNVNFLNLVNNPELSEEWRGIRELIDPGEGYANIDVCMFNYLANRPGGPSYRDLYDLRVHVGPNPLPLHSLLNCITVSCSDGLIFNFRTSYGCDVERLRAAFQTASRSW
ncbi:amino acid adenylation domain-containing protein [Sorangium sp. So ce341]|uniref:amino acid adenylation domain-containing protein n=1 Tax=Sorangium sp. So ce341 TaxID=3133302 RepID=UPI003F5FF309